jgi:integrase
VKEALVKHTINLEPAAEVLDGRQLNDLIHLWLEKLRLRPDVTAHTVTGYSNRIDYFVEWWDSVGPWCGWELTRDRLGQFGDWLLTVHSQYRKPLEYNSRKDILRRLKQCFKWAFENDYLSRDVTPWVPVAVGSAPLRERATLDELAALMVAAGRSGCPVRDQALVAIYVGTGLRKMEAAGLDVSDVRMDADLSGTAVVRQAKRVRGRQVQARVVAFDRWTGSYLAALMDTYPEQSGPLFRVVGGGRLSAMAAYRAVKKAIDRAGLADKIEGPHDLRRNFATWFSKTHRGELYGRLLSKQLGHSGFVMTDHYIMHDADDLTEVIKSPLADYPLTLPEGPRVAVSVGLQPRRRKRHAASGK